MRSVSWAALAVFLVAGCGGAGHPTAAVTGTVTWKGRPLVKGRVLFMHDSGPIGYGDIGPDGRYKLDAPIGECRVAVSCREDPPQNLPPEKDVPGAYITRSLISEKYEDHMQSGLKFMVKASGNTADWKLD